MAAIKLAVGAAPAHLPVAWRPQASAIKGHDLPVPQAAAARPAEPATEAAAEPLPPSAQVANPRPAPNRTVEHEPLHNVQGLGAAEATFFMSLSQAWHHFCVKRLVLLRTHA